MNLKCANTASHLFRLDEECGHRGIGEEAEHEEEAEEEAAEVVDGAGQGEGHLGGIEQSQRTSLICLKKFVIQEKQHMGQKDQDGYYAE